MSPNNPVYTIGEAAEVLKVTTRTLRHWDHLGILSPEWRTMGDHRLYTDDDLQRGMDILIYRGAGVELRDIPALLDAAPADAAARLRAQRAALVARRGEVDAMLRAVDALLKDKETTMEKKSVEKKIEALGEDWPAYQEEADSRWGGTDEWAQSAQVQKNMSAQDWADAKAQHEDFVALLDAAAADGVEPGTDRAREVVDAHFTTIARWYDTTRSKQVVLARMYCVDERFNETYHGNAPLLRDFVEVQAASEGLDLSAVTWG